MFHCNIFKYTTFVRVIQECLTSSCFRSLLRVAVALFILFLTLFLLLIIQFDDEVLKILGCR